MSLLLATPLEAEQVEAIRKRFPRFEGEAPPEVLYWSEADLEAFFSSSGKVRPRETRAAGSTCALLSRIRLRLAEDKISEATEEYRSFCRHLRKVPEHWYRSAGLPSVSECMEVARARTIPEGPLRSPLVLEKPKDWKARLWNLEFWKRECGLLPWTCRTRHPAFEGDDVGGIDPVYIPTTVEEYVDYVRVIQKMDRKCEEENCIAFPRLALDGLRPFNSGLDNLFKECWRDLAPPGVTDYTPRWLEMFAELNRSADWEEILARFYRVCLSPTGCVGRLHVAAHGAHQWFNQIEGRKLFFLFSPQESKKLYEEAGRPMEEEAGFATRASPVDIFAPSKRHPLLSEAKAQVAVLYLGQSLVVPSGWWVYSVTLDPSVTLSHQFWNFENRLHFVESLHTYFDFSVMRPEYKADKMSMLERLHQMIVEESDADL